jgi:diacylglycerol kinase
MHFQHWLNKFRCAFYGLWIGAAGQTSFRVHGIMTIAVAVLATLLRCSLMQWCILLLCIASVVSAEYFNSSLERLASALCKEHNPDVGAALDIASAGVLIISLVAALIGCLIFVTQMCNLSFG